MNNELTLLNGNKIVSNVNIVISGINEFPAGSVFTISKVFFDPALKDPFGFLSFEVEEIPPDKDGKPTLLIYEVFKEYLHDLYPINKETIIDWNAK